MRRLKIHFAAVAFLVCASFCTRLEGTSGGDISASYFSYMQCRSAGLSDQFCWVMAMDPPNNLIASQFDVGFPMGLQYLGAFTSPGYQLIDQGNRSQELLENVFFDGEGIGSPSSLPDTAIELEFFDPNNTFSPSSPPTFAILGSGNDGDFLQFDELPPQNVPRTLPNNNPERTSQSFGAVFPSVPPPLAALALHDGQGPPPQVINGWDGRALRLTHDGSNFQNNGVAFNRVVGGPYDLLQILFDFNIDPTVQSADGIGIVYANTAVFGPNNNSPPPNWQAEEPSLAGSLGVGFDTWNNSAADPGPTDGDLPNSFSLHFDGARIGQVVTTELDLPSDWLQNGNPKVASILVEPVGGGSNVTVLVQDTSTFEIAVPFNDAFVSGLSPYDGRIVVRSRTGIADANHEVDNFVINHTPTGRGDPDRFTVEDFESYGLGELPSLASPVLAGGMEFSTERFGSSPAAVILQEQPGTTGLGDGFVRLATEKSSQSNVIAFDNASDAVQKITAQFSMRIIDSDGNVADGLSIVFLPVDQYGDTGGAGLPIGQEPNLSGALGFGFDTFDNDEEDCPAICVDRRANHVSAHFDGALVSDIVVLNQQSEIDLVNGEWNDVLIQIEDDPMGAKVTMLIRDGDDGSVSVPYSQLVIPEMQMNTPYRVAFASATGFFGDNHDVDNVNVVFHSAVPVDPCDFNLDGVLDVADVDFLHEQVLGGTANLSFDVSGDGVVDTNDILFMVEEKFNSGLGDFNLDGVVGLPDFNLLRGGFAGPGLWSDGDHNLDGIVGLPDLNLLRAFFGVTYGTSPAEVVPEPGSPVVAVLVLGVLSLAVTRRRKPLSRRAR